MPLDISKQLEIAASVYFQYFEQQQKNFPMIFSLKCLMQTLGSKNAIGCLEVIHGLV